MPVTELVIDSAKAVAGAADYSRAMDTAASAAQRGLGAISDFATQAKGSIANLGSAAASMGPSMATMAVGVTAAAAAFMAGFEAVKKMTAGLAEMGLSARRSNLDVETFQKLQFATGVGGVSSKDFSTGTEKLASNLSEARREANDMSKLLDANNVKWKDGNKLILDTNGLLNVARDLIHRAGDEQQKIKMAEMLGLTKDWVPALDKSAQEFAALQGEATALGLVISRDTIEKAKQFDDEWRKSSEVFSTWMKAKLADLLPLLDELISKAGEFKQGVMDSLDAAANSPAGQEFTLRSNRAAAIMEMASVENTAKENADILAAAAKALAGTLSDTTAKLIDQQIATKGLAKFWNDYATSMTGAAAAAEKFAKTAPVGANDNKGKPSVLPPKKDEDEARDAWDRAISTLDRHIGKLHADTLAVGQSTAAQAGLRAEFALLEAAQAAEKGVTDDQIAKYAQLRASMSATQALTAAGIKLDEDDVEILRKKSEAMQAATAVFEKSKIASDIKRGRDTALLSSEDVAIANQLKGIYPEVADALGSVEASALRVNNAIRQMGDALAESASSFVKDISHGVSAADAMRNAMSRLSDQLIDMAVKGLVKQALGGMAGNSGGGGLLSLLGLGGNSGGGAVAGQFAADGSLGVVGSAGSYVVPTFHDGGIAGTTPATRYVHPAYFENAPRYHGGGLAGDEVPAILRRGEPVFTSMDHARRVVGGNSGPQTVSVSMSIDLKGANGDATIAQIAGAAAKQAFAQAVKTANQNAPAQQRRYNLLGSS